MTAIDIPAIPAGITILLNLFAPYGVSLIVDPKWSAKSKQLISIAVSIVLAVLVLLVSHFGFGQPLPASWGAILVLAVVIAQASYTLILKESADALSTTKGTGTGSVIDAGTASQNSVPSITNLPASTDEVVPDFGFASVAPLAATPPTSTAPETVPAPTVPGAPGADGQPAPVAATQ
jgi:hypothetical protein